MKIKSLILATVLATAILCSGGFVSAQAMVNSALITQLQTQIIALIAQIKMFSASLSGSNVVSTTTPEELMQSLYNASVTFKNMSSWKSDYAFCMNNSPALLGNTVANIKSGLSTLGYATFTCNDGDTASSCYSGSVSASNWYAITSNGTNYICADKNGVTESSSNPTTTASTNCSCSGTVTPTTLQIKTARNLQIIIGTTTFLNATFQANFTANAQDIINAGETLNLNFTATKDSNSIGLYNPTKMYIEDGVIVKSNQCSRFISMSHHNKSNPNTPLLNSSPQGICGILSAAKSLISTLKLGTPSGAPSPTIIAPPGTNGSTTSTVVWNNMFLEWLIRSSGVPINGITPFNMTNFYSNYISALGNKTSFTTVQTTMYGTFAPGTPGAPAPTSIVPITSNGTQQIIVKAMASGNVDCDLATTGHLSHINSVSQPNPPSGDMWLTIDNSLDMGEAPSYSNAPFNSGTTTFRISSTGTITPYSGVGTNFNNPEDSNWEDPGSYATFVVVCHKLS